MNYIPALLAFGTFCSVSLHCEAFGKESYSQPLIDGPFLVIVPNADIGSGPEVDLVLDTGCRAVAIFDDGLISNARGPVTVVNGSFKEALIPFLKVAGATLNDRQVEFRDLDPIFENVNGRESGIVGLAPFADSIVYFDYDAKRLSIHAAPFPDWPGFETMSYSLEKGDPLFYAALNGWRTRFILDTGFNGDITLSPRVFEDWVQTGFASAKTNEGETVGLGKSRKGDDVAILKKGQLLGVPLAGMEVTMSPTIEEGGAVGIDFLRKFNFAFEPSQNALHYKRRKSVPEALTLEELIGARLSYQRGSCAVKSVPPDGKGAFVLAGGRAGDAVLRFGDVTADKLTWSVAYLECLKHRGKPLPMTVRRDGKEIELLLNVSADTAQ
jgi:hypothetical protein